MGYTLQEVLYALKWLDKEYHLLSEKAVKIKNPDFSDEPQEYDHIVIGPTGIILIETKAYSGKIVIDENGNWRRNKYKDEWVGEVNPLQQVRRHEKVISSIVKDIPIRSYVCLANENVIIDGIENSPLKIVKADLLVESIENITVEKKLTENQIKKIIELLSKYIV